MEMRTLRIVLIVLIGVIQQFVYAQEYGRELDSLALVALYDSTDGANWTNNTNWLSSEPVNSWFGVTVSGNRVTQLQQRSNNLNGIIPVEICNLTELLTLDFYVNKLSGPIPENIGNLSGLTRLYLNHNQLDGQIPESLWQLTALTQLYLNSNNLTGPLSDSIGNLVNLEYLVLFANSLSDSIPKSIGNLTRLRELNLYRNTFSGPLPVTITKIDSLRKLTLFVNLLEGPLPEDIDNLSRLESISIASNRFSGPIPQNLGNLKNLTFLDLQSNSFEGPIPVSIGNLTGLTLLSLSHNDLNGSIPDTLGNLINMTTIYLDNNQLSGQLPASLGRLTGLTALLVNNNQLSGVVPAEITNLAAMNTFFIDNNQLDDLPDLSSMSSLTSLAIQNNRFTFEDIEPNIGFSSGTFTYSPQSNIGMEIDSTIDIGTSYTMSVFIGGENNAYQWYKDNQEIPAAVSDTFLISTAAVSDSGTYVCRVTNSVVSGLTISSEVIHLVVVDPTGISASSSSTPKNFALYQNYPNPFNPTTTIEFSLPKTEFVILKIFNLFGQTVATLVSEKLKAGNYTYTWDAGKSSSGLYYYQLQTNTGFIQTKKLILLK